MSAAIMPLPNSDSNIEVPVFATWSDLPPDSMPPRSEIVLSSTLLSVDHNLLAPSGLDARLPRPLSRAGTAALIAFLVSS